MSLHSRRGRMLTPGAVALADILANSVAVILILILATLVYRQEQAREELERNTDITTILARQLATTVVFNDLPSSPPSVLHDYDSCAIPHDCDPMLFPILELHKGYLRIFNSNTRIYRAELLRQENAFDRYLAALPEAAAKGIRLDVHSVSEYYLALGIMQEHGLWPRHWHYLGEHVPPLANATALEERVAGIGGPASEERRPDGRAPGVGHGDGRRERRAGRGLRPGDGDGDGAAGLEGARLAGAGVLDSLQYDSLLPPSVTAGRGGAAAGGGSGLPPPRRADSMLNRQGLPGPLGTARRGMRLFVPNAVAATGGAEQVLRVPPEWYSALALHYVLRVLETAREERAFDPTRANRWLLELARRLQTPQGAEALAALPHHALVQRLAADLQTAADLQVAAGPFPPPLRDMRSSPERPWNRLLIAPYETHGARALLLHQPTDWLQPLRDAAQARTQFLLRSHPALFKGEVLALPPGYLLLLLPDEMETTTPRWRPLAVVEPSLENIALGFVYAGIEEGRLAVHAGVNQLRLNGRPAANPRLHDKDRMRSLTPVLWILALLGLLALLRFVAPRPGRGGMPGPGGVRGRAEHA